MRFSIIVPVYNIQEYIKQCITSILAQKFEDFQLILVDDGSTDKSSQICDFYAKLDSRIKVIHKINGGLVSARKAGCKIAQGEYVLCIDGDDWVEANYLESLNEIIEKHRPDMICFGYYIVKDEKKEISVPPISEGIYNEKTIREEFYPSLIQTINGTSFPTSIWSKAIKRNIYFDEQMSVSSLIKIGEDSACVIPCIYKSKSIYVLCECLYSYRYNVASMTKAKKPLDIKGPRLVDEHLRKRVDIDKFEFEEQINRRTTHALFNVIKSQFYGVKYKKAKKIVMQLFNNTFYRKVICDSHFSGTLEAWILDKVMSHKMVNLIYLISKFR